MSAITSSGGSTLSSVVTSGARAGAPRACHGRRDRPPPAGSSPRPRVTRFGQIMHCERRPSSTRPRADPRRASSSRRTRSSRTPGAPRRRTSATSSRGSCTSRSPGTRPAAGTASAASGSSRRRARRLAPLRAEHRGVDVAALLAQVERPRSRARGLARPAPRRSETGLAEPDRVERAVQRDVQPPVAVEEEQQAERDEGRRRCDADRPVVVAQPAERAPSRARTRPRRAGTRAPSPSE